VPLTLTQAWRPGLLSHRPVGAEDGGPPGCRRRDRWRI